VRVSVNDMGATPAVVSLRLDQAVSELAAMTAHRFVQLCRMLGARAPARLVDAGKLP
jgi:hypothetical protein